MGMRIEGRRDVAIIRRGRQRPGLTKAARAPRGRVSWAMAGRRYAIIGDGAAGMTAAQALRRLDPAGVITVVSDDPHPTYFRAALTNYLLGELRDDQLWAVPPSFHRDLRVERVFARVAAVDTAAGALRLASGAALPYESLLVASGARARPASFEGAHLPGVLTLRTLHDARQVMDLVGSGGLRRAVVCGGGPLALEWAHALRERGVEVELVVRGERLMPDALDATASDLLLARLRRGGVAVRVGDEVASAAAGAGGRVAGVQTQAGASLPCDLVAVAIGVACNTELLAGSAVALGPRGGVEVSDRLRSSVANVFAAGDVAEIGGRLLQLWEPARHAAEVAAENMTGGDVAYAPGAHYFATRLHDLDFAAVGSLDASAGDVVLVDHPRLTGRIAYRKLVLRGSRLVAALMIGEREAGVRKRGRLYKRLIDAGLDVTAVQGDLLDPAFDLRGWLETKAMVERPRAVAAGPSPAAVRGTQRLALPAAPQAATVSAEPLALQTVAGVAPMLTVGLRLPGAPPLLAPAAAPSYLEGPGHRFPLDREVVSLGAHPASDIVLADASVSPLHAQITLHDASFYLRDAGSRGGTWVNGALVTVPHLLHEGDRLRLGAVELVFRGPGEDAASPAAAVKTPEPHGPPVLEIRAGAGVGLRFALVGPHATLGRDPTSTIRLDDLSVSRRHAALAELDGRWFVTDLHSSRGTRKNGAPLVAGQDAALEAGDALTLGEIVLVYAPAARRR
jgi:NADPH-dependent 2,4-dienoyl-CoA reductase/sulfur reductase-like enzyme/pSer/pThr/pTyr-binding forkhead associated (FHA) protein